MHGNAPQSSTALGTVAGSDTLAYSVKRAAKVIDVSERMMWNLIATGEVQSVKIGRSRRVERAALVAYLDRLREEAAA